MNAEVVDKPLTYEEERGKPLPSRNHAGIQVNLIVEFAKHHESRVYSEFNLFAKGFGLRVTKAGRKATPTTAL